MKHPRLTAEDLANPDFAIVPVTPADLELAKGVSETLPTAPATRYRCGSVKGGIWMGRPAWRFLEHRLRVAATGTRPKGVNCRVWERHAHLPAARWTALADKIDQVLAVDPRDPLP